MSDMNIKAFGKQIIVEKVVEKKVAGKILMQEKVSPNQLIKVRSLSIGDKVENRDDIEGKILYVTQYTGSLIVLDGKEFVVIEGKDIMGYVK